MHVGHEVWLHLPVETRQSSAAARPELGGCTAISLRPSSAPCSPSSKAALEAFKSVLLQATV